jgi:hypothetical protein
VNHPPPRDIRTLAGQTLGIPGDRDAVTTLGGGPGGIPDDHRHVALLMEETHCVVQDVDGDPVGPDREVGGAHLRERDGVVGNRPESLTRHRGDAGQARRRPDEVQAGVDVPEVVQRMAVEVHRVG